MTRAVKRVRLQDVAAAAGVSTASVSLVLRGVAGPAPRTREKVLEAAARLGYRADRSASLLARHRTRLLGVPVLLRDPFRSELAEHVHRAAEAAGYTVALGAIVDDEVRVVETLLDLRCEAVVLLAPTLPQAGLAGLAERVPLVVVGRAVVPEGFDVVRVADGAGIAAVVEHLRVLGHRRIVHVDGADAPMAAERRTAFVAAAGPEASVLPGGDDEAAGAAAARLLLRDLPTAVVAANDRAAIGLLDVFVRAGVRVPQDVSVAGYDDSALARMAHIDLTTVSQESDAQAARAVAAALERLDAGRQAPTESVLSPRLVVRGSTGPARP